MNALIILAVTAPVVLCLDLDFFQARIAFLCVSVAYLAAALLTQGHRSIGMVVMGVRWRENYSLTRLTIYALLYLLSLSTLLLWVYFPLDLLMANILLLQLPCVLLTGTTFHGFISGRITTMAAKGRRGPPPACV